MSSWNAECENNESKGRRYMPEKQKTVLGNQDKSEKQGRTTYVGSSDSDASERERETR